MFVVIHAATHPLLTVKVTPELRAAKAYHHTMEGGEHKAVSLADLRENNTRDALRNKKPYSHEITTKRSNWTFILDKNAGKGKTQPKQAEGQNKSPTRSAAQPPGIL